MFPSVQTVVDHLLAPVGWGAVITFFGSVAWFLLKTKGKASDLISRLSNEWSEARQDIRDSKSRIDLAVSNHLTHIEAATSTTAALLERQNEMFGRLVDSTTQNAVTLAKIEAVLTERKNG
jgi:formate-dependent nitrite reductase cytochrome c552 subunit